ncbi:MAG: MFS transporter [Pseudomonadota bacterium]
MSGAQGRAARLRLLVLLAACTAIGPISLNVYLPGLPAVQAEFAATLAEVQTTVSMALLAFGLALILLGPLSDRFGRRPVLLVGLALCGGGSLLAMLAQDLLTLTIARMVQSAGAAVAFICARAVVADITPREHLQRSVAQVTMIMLVAQMAAPPLGNIALTVAGWRSIQLAVLIVTAVLFVLIARKLRETLPVSEEPRGFAPGWSVALFRPSFALLRRPRFNAMMLQAGVLYSAYPAFIAIAPHLMIEAFHRPATEYGYYFAFLPMGYFGGNWLVLHIGQRLGAHRLVFAGCLFATLSCVLGVVVLGQGVWHPLALFLPAGLLLNFGMGMALPSVSARAIGEAWPNTASAWGLVGFSQQFVAACGVQLLGYFSSESPFPVMWFCGGLTLLALLMESLVVRLPHTQVERGA